MINESKGKKIIGISGGNKKLFIFEEENGKYDFYPRILKCRHSIASGK